MMAGQSSITVINREEMCFLFYAQLQRGNEGEGRPGKNERAEGKT